MERPQLSWRAKLAKSNINILNIDFDETGTNAVVYYEFMYHPYQGSTKWSKTFTEVMGKDVPHIPGDSHLRAAVTFDDIGRKLSEEVLALRKELEG